MQQSTHSAADPYSPWPHRLALLTAVCTLPLLFVGGLVTSLGVGLAVPDWPTTFGYNMFLYPWSKMVGGIFYEHSHRLLGSAVGFLTILLTIALWTKERRRWMRWLGIIALIAVLIQGVLGGLRVILLEHVLAIVHGCFAQAFFAFLAALSLLTEAEWQQERPSISSGDARSIQRGGVLVTSLLYGQLILGAILRHTGSGAAIHIVGAAIIAIAIFWLVDWLTQSYSDQPLLRQSAFLLRRLLLLQLTLGIAAYISKYTDSQAFLESYAVLFATSHVLIGALMLATSVRLTLRVYHTLVPVPSSALRFAPEQT